ncbi:MAG: hypothetical protein JL50_05780 [Peptococcaceae bacterium BICA1-7]|nr:MAG: hypothetical protein JL50_05780 [Peptococcaceae bacterium BICA1-7]
MKKSLCQIYAVQLSNCLPDQAMPRIMEKLGLDEEGAIELLNSLIRLGWLSTGHIIPKFYLRPGFVSFFPVIVSTSGRAKIEGLTV